MDSAMRTVFIVDDARQVRKALSRLLAAADYQVRAFESAEHFLREQDAETPGCLVLDVCMPGLSGLDLQRLLVEMSCARPIVFLSGKSDIQTSVHAMKAGAVDFSDEADRRWATSRSGRASASTRRGAAAGSCNRKHDPTAS